MALADDIRAAMAASAQEDEDETDLDDSTEAVETPAEAVEETTEEAVEEKEIASGETESTEAVKPPILPPAHWDKEHKEFFGTLPREIQDVIVKRETDRERGVSKKITEIEQQRKAYEELEKELQPNLETWGLAGKQPAQVVRQLVAMQNFLNRDPVSALNVIAQSYGLDLRNLGSHGGNGTAQTGDPQVRSLMSMIDNLQSRLSTYEQQSQQGQYQGVERDIEQFATEKDAAGNELRPYFQNVADEIARLIPIYRAEMPEATHREVLQTVYEKAVWANPDTRQAMLKMQEQTRLAELKRKSEQAKRASKGISGSPGQTVQTHKKDLRSTLEKAFEDFS